MKFKFVGAGQIFRPDREPAARDPQRPRRGRARSLAGAARPRCLSPSSAWSSSPGRSARGSTRGRSSPAPSTTAAVAAVPSPDEAGARRGRRSRARRATCEAAHEKLATLAATLAGAVIARLQGPREPLGRPGARRGRRRAGPDAQARALPAGGAGDRRRARAPQGRGRQAPDAGRRGGHRDGTPSGPAHRVRPGAAGSRRRAPARCRPTLRIDARADDPAAPTGAPPPAPSPTAASTATPTDAEPTATAGSSERPRAAPRPAGGNDAKTALKSQLEQKVYSGRASADEIRLLISTCKDLGDKLCVAQARASSSRRASRSEAVTAPGRATRRAPSRSRTRARRPSGRPSS